ncbi:MAG: 50S ribosomal protein L23 [SAR202 cluster bacterium]|nr:50S ribosomal protein L23 [SAR202 cluster bacterium]
MTTTVVLKRPIVTEKSTRLMEQGRYVFEIAATATKLQVKEAVESAFEVKVVAVNTQHVRGKRRRLGPRFTEKPSWKKAVVTLAPGNKITLFEGV